MTTWITTDPHWNISNGPTYCVRPKNYTERSIKMWRNTVKDGDTVICLGDVAINGYEQVKPILDTLPGTKILVEGNHDWSKSSEWWMRNGFAFSCKGLMWNDVWLSHFPVDFLPQYAKLNIHGHCHIQRRSWEKLKPFNKLMCTEYEDYTPRKLEKFIRSDKITERVETEKWKHILPY